MYEEKRISAKVERILYPREVNEFEVKNISTFYILRVELNGRNEVAKGKMSNMPRQGERFCFEGKWEVSRYSGGMEFLFFHYSIDLPTDERSLLRLACEMTKGIGVALETKIWETLGENWRKIKYSDNIRGLTPAILSRLQETIEELNNQRERTSTVAWLMSVGCTVKMSEAAYDKWGTKTAVRVKEDPYLLAELPNYGFKDVDEHVRDKFGIGTNDVRRVRAAIIYYVKQLTISDTVCAWPILFDKIHKAIDAEPAFISQICSDLFKDGVLVPFRSSGMIAWHIDNANESAILAYATEAGAPSGLKASQPKQAGFTFDESQLAAIQFALDSRFCVINGGAGCGKCLGRGTPVIMHDFTVKKVEDVRVGDVLLGPRGEPKHVTSVTSGREEMFRVTPKRGDAFTCNRSHILSVVHSRKRISEYTTDAKAPFNISVNDILTKLKPAHREHLKCWRPSCIQRPATPVPLDPYFLGVWLGDGASSRGSIRIANSDAEIIGWLKYFATSKNMVCRIRDGYFRHTCPIVEIANPLGKGHSNFITDELARLNLHDNKHIPLAYLDNDEHTRLSLLAGLLDSDGYYANGQYEITQKVERLANDIAFLARSLGFGVSLSPVRKQCCNNGVWGDYFRVFINGDLDRIPCIVARKKAMSRRQKKNHLVSGITVESIGEGDYFGFTLAEEDGLFLLGDFTVTHNTTIIKSIADTLRDHCMTVELCAFAGKAAARLKEATEHEACTIHRMLDYRGDFGFTRNSLRGSTIILDEASMVASDLLAEIIKRKPDRLILVGDEAQLPPVGSGQPFHDIVRLFPDRVRTLTTCYRNKEAIFHAALQIRSGMAPDLHAQSERELWDVESIGNLRSTHARVLALVKEGGVDFDKDIILCCRNGDTEGEAECSVVSLNADIKAIVNPSADDGETKYAQRVDPGDRVINTKNHADLDVWNGTTGTCDRFDASGAMWVKLDYPNAQHEDFVLIPKKHVREWQLAYALTVHKSQGSQYRKVFFVCTRRDTAALLDRPMLYTAVTRAKAECRVIGDTGAFYKAIVSTENKQTVIQQLVAQRGA